MKRTALLILSLVLSLTATLSAEEMKTIELTDGSVLTGEVVSLSKGVYTIRTDSMGTLTVPDSKIKTIRAKDPAGAASPAPGDVNAGELTSLMSKMMADQDIMSMIDSLKDDPEFMNILQDPEVLKAIQDNNTAALTANPKFMKLMDNATVRNIQKKTAP